MRILPILMLPAFIGLAGCGGASPPEQPSFYASMANEGAAVDAAAAASMISGYRGNNGLGAVEVDANLMRMAMEHARAMATKDKIERSAGREFTGRLATAGFDGRQAVENVGAGYHTLAEAFSGWRDSPPHRANMLKGGVTRLGIAAVYAPQSKYKVFWALIMAAKNERRG
ncbi:MAG: CAP domain-containing protein [Bradyrhizobiaceae bacterium]|nr:CAP domain-containing protein [Bradyrhizobiaceae bacterium]